MPELPARRICLIRTSALGDVVHALPLVNGLRRGYPDAHLTWILHPVPYQVVRHQPNVDRFLVVERRGGLGPWLTLARQLAGERFDLLLLPQVSAKAGLIAALVRAEIKVGFDFARSRELHWLFVNRHLPAREPQHVQDHYLEFLEFLGIDPTPVEWNITFTEAENAYRQEFLASLGRPPVAFVIASSNPEKDWPAASYATVMEEVAQGFGMQPVIVGGPSPRETALANEIVSSCRTRVVNALEPSVRRMLVQLSAAEVVVAPDTGPLHAAVALGVPTVGLFGYSDPRRCGPYRRYHDLLIDHFSDPGEEHRKIRRITRRGRMARIAPTEVINRIELALERYRGWTGGSGERSSR